MAKYLIDISDAYMHQAKLISKQMSVPMSELFRVGIYNYLDSVVSGNIPLAGVRLCNDVLFSGGVLSVRIAGE